MPVRKAGKLPAVAASRTYELEYGTATLELPADALAPGARVLLVDDVLATGGTAEAACELVSAVGAEVAGSRRCSSWPTSADAPAWAGSRCTHCCRTDHRAAGTGAATGDRAGYPRQVEACG